MSRLDKVKECPDSGKSIFLRGVCEGVSGRDQHLNEQTEKEIFSLHSVAGIIPPTAGQPAEQRRRRRADLLSFLGLGTPFPLVFRLQSSWFCGL